MQLFFAGPTLNWVYIVRSLHRYFRLFHRPTLVPQLIVYIAAALSGESRWNGLPTLEGVGVGDGMLMGRPESQRQGHKAQGINTLVMG